MYLAELQWCTLVMPDQIRSDVIYSPENSPLET